MVRDPIVAGRFYAGEFKELENQIKQSFNAKFGPGDLPVSRDESQKIKGIIVPHAGYEFSGPCAAWAYKEIAETKFPKTFVLLGFSHHGESSGISIEDWKTPFGVVKTDKDLARELKQTTSLSINESPHMQEHSLEVQLPFLQFVNKDRIKDMRILPISCSRDIDFKTLGDELYSLLNTRDVVFIVSSDFTHYGPNYGYVPFTTDIEKRLNDLDKKAIDMIVSLDISGFTDFINRTHITICGYYPILVFMKILTNYETKPESSLLMHYTSGDLVGDHRNSVSYASLLFK